MTSLNSDANKLPLGKLSRNTLRKGNSMLKQISELPGDLTVDNMSRSEALADLTSRYYTIIPHIFGRAKPPVINNVGRLKREAELIESLSEMEIAKDNFERELTSFLLGTGLIPLDDQSPKRRAEA
jgi:poly [ADP-ribose] polymerase 2/3/4